MIHVEGHLHYVSNVSLTVAWSHISSTFCQLHGDVPLCYVFFCLSLGAQHLLTNASAPAHRNAKGLLTE